MSKTQNTPVLITGFTCRLNTIRQEALGLILNAVAEHKVIGTFYKNRGVDYRDYTEAEKYDSSPIVATCNPSFGSYGGYQAATLYELFLDGQDRLRCTLNGEAGGDFDEPIEHIQTEGLLRIVEWLVEYGFIADDPWRCEECGSLSVQANVWIDSNTKAVMLGAQNRDEHHCADCNANTCQIRQSELMQNIDKWWHDRDFRQMERITGYRQNDFDSEDGYQAFVDAYDNLWNTLSTEEKIGIWKNNQ